MGLFNKEKISQMANKAKETVKSSIEESIAESERRKELGLLKDVNFSLEYQGGHPSITKDGKSMIYITNENFKITCGSQSSITGFENITGIHYENAEQVEKRITATRLIALGPFALAFKKKKKTKEKFLTVDLSENGIDNTILFGGKYAQEAHSALCKRYSNYLKRVEISQPEVESRSEKQSQINSYEEIKKAKELLDMGIITQEEFDAKKKQLLGL